MSLKSDFDEMKDVKNPTGDDYIKLLIFTGYILFLYRKERKARSALKKKNRRLITRLGLIARYRNNEFNWEDA